MIAARALPWCAALLACTTACLGGVPLPASSAPAPTTADVVVAVAVAVPDTIAQRVQACTACHGKEGLATDQGYFPRIAGKPRVYLYNQLVGFRDGHRNNRTMYGLLANMSDAYLMEIAAYFAALDLPYAPPTQRLVPALELERGRKLAHAGDAAKRLPACTQCHGSTLTGVTPTVPALVGLSKAYLLAQLGAWRSGQRQAKQPDCMNEISRRLSIDDIAAVASYLAQQPVPTDAKPAAQSTRPLPLNCGSIPP